jgi:hypothetical protein
MLKTAVEDDNPVILYENPGLYGIKGQVPDDPNYKVPFGKAQILREGSDLSLIGYSRMTHVNLAAAELLEKDGIHAEVVDVRSLLPLDTETIFNSVRKTHRAVVVYEDWRSGGFGRDRSPDRRVLFRRSGRPSEPCRRSERADALRSGAGAGVHPGRERRGRGRSEDELNFLGLRDESRVFSPRTEPANPATRVAL